MDRKSAHGGQKWTGKVRMEQIEHAVFTEENTIFQPPPNPTKPHRGCLGGQRRKTPPPNHPIQSQGRRVVNRVDTQPQ